MSRRTERVNELLREEISDLLRTELSDPRIGGIVTVTHVDVSPDLRHALAYVSVLGTDDERTRTLKALDHARPFLRRELSRRLPLRYTPDVAFRERHVDGAGAGDDRPDAAERQRARRDTVTGADTRTAARDGDAA